MVAARGLILAGMVALSSPAAAAPDGPLLVALAEDGTLISFSADRPADARTAKVTGASGELIGLDRRPAYTNNVAWAERTEMFDLDSGHDLLLKQDPPNDGTLLTVGSVGVHVPPHAGFEIVTDGSGRNRGFAAFASTLYEIDLATGAA